MKLLECPDDKDQDVINAILAVAPKTPGFVGSNKKWVRAVIAEYVDAALITQGKRILATQAIVNVSGLLTESAE